MDKYCRILGLDLSLSSTGFCTVDMPSGETSYGVIKTALSEDIYGRYAYILSAVTKLLFVNSVVLIEDYSFGSFQNSSSVTKLAELGGIIKHSLYNKGTEMYLIPPTKVKKFLCGNGKAKKEDMKLAAYKRFGIEPKTSDEVDAYTLAYIGKYLWYSYYDSNNLKLKDLNANQSVVISKLKEEGPII